MISAIADLGNGVQEMEGVGEDLDADLFRAESIVEHAKISEAVSELERMVEEQEDDESDFQSHFEDHAWFFGNRYIETHDTNFLTGSVPDFALESVNGYLELIELKTPSTQLLRYDDSHDNWFPRAPLTKAITQLQNYIHESEEIQNKIENGEGVQVLKPRGIIVAGSNLDEEKRNGLRLIESHLTRIDLLTYTDLIQRGYRMKEFYESA